MTGGGSLETVESPPEVSAANASREAKKRGAGPRPRLGFLGVGWIGRNRMEAIAASGVAEVAAIADASAETRTAARAAAPSAELTDSFEALLGMPLDGIVIATPSAQHAEQAIAALERGFAVFCQKPLGRTAAETARVVHAARRADRLLGVDFSYRFVAAFQRLRQVVQAGEIGQVYAADLVFHNAYGPDKDWFYDPRLSGGGCVMDLGIHLVDLALWILDFPQIAECTSRLFAGGRSLSGRAERVEDYAVARLDLSDGPAVQMACSWRLSAGQDAVIGATFFGTEGGISAHNVGGSFFDFTTELYQGTRRETLVAPPDAWGGRAAVAWAERLGAGHRFDPAADELVATAAVLDRIYGG